MLDKTNIIFFETSIQGFFMCDAL